MGPGNPPAVQVWTRTIGRFSSRRIQQSDMLSLGRSTLDPYSSTCGCLQAWLDGSVPISGSEFWILHICSHPDMLQLVIEYSHWYYTVHFPCIVHLNDPNKLTQLPYHLLKMSINIESTIFCRVSWVICGCDRSYPAINSVLVAFIETLASEMRTTPSSKWQSKEQ